MHSVTILIPAHACNEDMYTNPSVHSFGKHLLATAQRLQPGEQAVAIKRMRTIISQIYS